MSPEGPAPAASLTAPSRLAGLYLEHHRWLVGWLHRRVGNAADAADLCQDTFVRVLGRPAGLLGADEPRAWLATVARGLVIDHQRRRAIEAAWLASLALLPEPEQPSPETRLILLETLVAIDAMLDGLALRARRAFLLSRLDGLTYPAIADRLGVSLSTVEKDMAVALRHAVLMRARLPA